MVHIFSHIHQTYIVYSVSVEDEHATEETQSEKLQWLTRPALLEAAVSTGLKKVCLHHIFHIGVHGLLFCWKVMSYFYHSSNQKFSSDANTLFVPFLPARK